jgi:antitoxin component YwqK of YwqJK toxin-antitoxin module
MNEFKKIAVLDNMIEAQMLDSMLNGKNIPHTMRTYNDSAYDGLFQMSTGWGHVEAPEENREEILAILEDLRIRAKETQNEPSGETENEPPSDPGKHIPFLLGILIGASIACLGWRTYNHWYDNGRAKTYDKKGRTEKTYYYIGGKLDKVESDRNGDGKIDEWFIYSSGTCVRVLADQNFDGRIDLWQTNSEDFGSIVRFDRNFDGKPDYVDIYVNGVLSESREDTDFNGIFDVTTQYKHGVPFLSEVRPNGTNVVFISRSFKDGILKEEWIDEDMDGKFDLKKEFDPMGKEVLVARLTNTAPNQVREPNSIPPAPDVHH